MASERGSPRAALRAPSTRPAGMGLPRGPRGEAEEAGRGGAGRGQTVFRPVEEDMEDPDVVLAFHHHGEVRHHPARRARVGGLRILGLGAVAAPRTTGGGGGGGGLGGRPGIRHPSRPRDAPAAAGRLSLWGRGGARGTHSFIMSCCTRLVDTAAPSPAPTLLGAPPRRTTPQIPFIMASARFCGDAVSAAPPRACPQVGGPLQSGDCSPAARLVPAEFVARGSAGTIMQLREAAASRRTTPFPPVARRAAPIAPFGSVQFQGSEASPSPPLSRRMLTPPVHIRAV